MSERHFFSPAEIGRTPDADLRIAMVPLNEQLNAGEPLPWYIRNALAADESAQPLDEMFDLTPADFTHIAAQATRFISQLPEAERARYERFLANDESDPPNVQDILMLSANLVRQATGEHQSDLGHDRQRHPLREHVDLDMRPPTVCRMFSREIRATYVLLARRYNPEVLETHRFVQTAANYSVDLPAGPDKSLFSKSRQVAHTYLTVVSYDSRQGIRITPFDPYHSGTELWSNDENGVQALDFSETRGVDSYRQVQNLFRLNDAAHNARGQEDLRIIDESLGLFTSGLNRLSNSLLVSEEVGMREQRATGDSIRELEAHLVKDPTFRTPCLRLVAS